MELIIILGALTAFAPLSIDMYLPALPAIAREFRSSIGSAEGTLATFFLGFSLGQAIFGPLADRFGRKPPLYGGMLLYVLASAGCALARNTELLMLLRFLQALGACAGVVVARACVRDLFAPRMVPRIFSYMMLVLGVAPLLAPLIGGYLLVFTGWRAIFWLQGAIGGLALGAVFLRLPETHGGGLRALHPVHVLRDYARLGTDRRFIGYVLAGAVSNSGMFAYITGSPHVFIDLFHVRPEHYGWIFGANALGIVACSQITARVLHRRPAEPLLLAAQIAQSIAGVALLAFALTGAGGLWGVAAGLFAFVSLNGAIMPTASGLAMHAFGAEAGMASALLGTIQFGAATVASSALGAFSPATAVPMAAVVAGCGILGLAVNRLLRPQTAPV